MKNSYYSNGYLESIQKGIVSVRTLGSRIFRETGTRKDSINKLRKEIQTADAIVIGAGAGLSTSAGLTYSGERFDRYFFDFRDRYGITDIYSGGFYPFPDKETQWAWWARHIYLNRYIDAPKPVYRQLLELVRDKDYFVITTNVDHQFQRVGFDKKRLFYTQGDYGLFQSTNPENRKTYDNEHWVIKAIEAQGFVLDDEGVYDLPEDGRITMRIPSELVPICPDDGYEFNMNLRSDDSFVEDEGWHKASAAYSDFIRRHKDLHVLYLELGVGANTPVIIKYPFWALTFESPEATYACINYSEAFCPEKIRSQSMVIEDDIGKVLEQLKQ